MDENELSTHLRRKIDSAQNDDGDEISQRRQRNMKYYRGDLYGNERDGISKIVTRECLEAVEWAMPSIMKIFGGQTNALAFSPIGPEDEDAADQETDVTRYYLFDQNNGFETLHAWAKDCLMYPNGYAKVWVDETEKATTERYHGLTEIQIGLLGKMEGVEIVGQEQRIEMLGDQPTPVFDVEVKRTTKTKVLKFEPVPGNEVLVDASYTRLDLDECEFVCHSVERSYTWLVNNGFDAAKLKDCQAESEKDYESEHINRRQFDEWAEDDDDALKKYTVHECYAWVDFDDDGIAEQRRIVMIGDTIFENEESDYCPLIAMTAILMSHSHTGFSVIDLVADLQEASSALNRQLLTNMYRVNVPRKYVGEAFLVDGGMSLDALLNLDSEIIPARDPTAIVPEPVQPMAQHILPAIQQIDAMKAIRTGINPDLALDPKVLRETTMGAYNAALSQASQRLELIIRVMAETGIKKAFQKAHRLIREHLGQTAAIKLRGAWIDVNPKEWKDRTNVRVQVGVGNQAKEEKAMLLESIFQKQMGLMQMGAPIVQPPQIFNTLSEMVKASGFRDATPFFTDPQTLPPPQPPPPDPMAELAKAQAQALMMEAQSKMAQVEATKQKMQLEAQIEAQKMQLEQRKAQIDQMKAQLDAAKSQSEIQVSREAALIDFRIKSAELMGKQNESALKDAQRTKTLAEAEQITVETRRMMTEPMREANESTSETG